tara:strand:- start:213 stop:860 length:648 start_codon:yes stop_codon:yes gene_type:complete
MIELKNIDCMKYIKRLEDNDFDLAIVDPPYGIDMADWDKKTDIPTKEYFTELFRISKNQVIFGGNYFNLPHTESWLCWDKTFNDDIKGGKLTKGGCPRDRMSDFELLWTSFDHKAKMVRFTQIGNLIGFGKNIKVDYRHKKKIHPTQKHSLLYEWILINYAKEGDKILDTHLGSGSIAIACHNLGFDLVGCELDKEYYETACKRLKLHQAQLRLL